jgi:hypothetical protein
VIFAQYEHFALCKFVENRMGGSTVEDCAGLPEIEDEDGVEGLVWLVSHGRLGSSHAISLCAIDRHCENATSGRCQEGREKDGGERKLEG